MPQAVFAKTLSRQGPLQLAGWGVVLTWTAVVAAVFGVWADHETMVIGYAILWLVGLGGIILGYRRLATQIAKRIRATDRLRYLANHDGLTQLPNRQRFFDLLGQVFQETAREGTRTALLLIGLDRFRTVNDVLGHDAGDVVLREVSRRLQAVVRERDVVARVGGDEFAVLMNDLPDAHVVARFANGILESISAPIDLSGDDLVIGAGIGIAFCPDNADNPQDLFRAAEIAMREVKDLEKTGFNFAGTAGAAALSRPFGEKAGASPLG